MKTTLIIVLSLLTAVSGFGVFSLQRELMSVKSNLDFLEKSNDGLRRQLTRVNRLYTENERILDEVEQGVKELEAKIDLETLERYVPKRTWNELKPAIDRLKALKGARVK